MQVALSTHTVISSSWTEHSASRTVVSALRRAVQSADFAFAARRRRELHPCRFPLS